MLSLFVVRVFRNLTHNIGQNVEFFLAKHIVHLVSNVLQISNLKIQANERSRTWKTSVLKSEISSEVPEDHADSTRVWACTALNRLSLIPRSKPFLVNPVIARVLQEFPNYSLYQSSYHTNYSLYQSSYHTNSGALKRLYFAA